MDFCDGIDDFFLEDGTIVARREGFMEGRLTGLVVFLVGFKSGIGCGRSTSVVKPILLKVALTGVLTDRVFEESLRDVVVIST